MKRHGLLFFVVINMIFLISCNNKTNYAKNPIGAGNENNKGSVSSIDISYLQDIEMSQIAVDKDGKIYITDKNRIYVLDQEGNKLNEISDSNWYYTNIIAVEEGIYAISSDMNLKYYTSGNISEKWDIRLDETSRSDQIRKIVYNNEKIFALQAKFINEKPTNELYIMAYSFDEDIQHEKLNPNIKNIRDFTVYKDSKLLLFTDTSCYIYDYKNNSETELEKDIPRGSAYFYNADEDVIYVLEKGQIGKIPLLGENVDKTYAAGIIPLTNKIAYINNEFYCIDKENKKIIRINMSRLENKTNLVVFVDSIKESASRLSKVADWFDLENPDIGIMFKEIGYHEYYNTLVTKTLAGDDDFDIFILNSNYVPGFIKNDALEDLSKYQPIKESFSDMFQGIEEMCSYKNNIFGVPMWMGNSDSVYTINNKLLDSLDLKIPQYNWTWKEFENLANSICKDERYYMMKNAKAEFWLFCMQLINDGIYLDIADAKLSYDIVKISERLEFTKKLYDKNIILDRHRLEGRENEDNILLRFAFVPSPELNSERIMPLPVFTGEVSYPFNINYLCVNNYSKNKEKAARFLSMCISKRSQSDNGIIGMPILYKDRALYDNSIYKDFILDDWNYNVYSYMLKHSHRLETLHYVTHIQEYYTQLMEDKITSKEAARKMIDKMRMVVEE